MEILLKVLLGIFAVWLFFAGHQYRTWKKIVCLVILAGCWYYLFYPALTLSSIEFWFFLMVLVLEAGSLFFNREIPAKPSSQKTAKKKEVEISLSSLPKKPVFLILAVLIVIPLVSALIFSPLFLAGSYSRRITPDTVDFSQVPSYSLEETAVIDRSSAQLLGDKVMGQMTDLVSQFTASEEYTQISWQGATVRVTPLAYDGFIKYMKNRASGVPGYIMVSTTTGKTELKRLDQKMRYVPSAYFNENLYRRLHFQYPFTLFGNPTFEVDEEGNPWYICTTYGYTGIHSRKRVTGAILMDPVTGTSTKYSLEDVPQWADRIYPADLVIEELNDWGKYQKGFFNSAFGQEGVIRTSEGYNYLAMDGDIWLYTGMTSAASDDSNVGFVLVNLRTHEAKYTATPGASEYAVMASAEGEVLNYGYTATFPTLLNIAGKPVYLLSLKDSAGLIKMYAMVDAQDYQQVYTVKSDRDAANAVSQLIRQVSGGKASTGGEETVTLKNIEALRSAVIDGNTYLYLKEAGRVYVIRVNEDNAAQALFITENSTVECTVSEMEDGTYSITSIQNVK